MAEEFVLSQLVLPGTYIRVRAEGLITVGGISTGTVGIVGTAAQGTGLNTSVSDYASAVETFGAYDAYKADDPSTLNLTRALEQLFRNGARSVYARAVAAGADNAAFTAAFNELIKEDVNILIAPELTTDNAKTVIASVLDTAESGGKDMISVIGSDKGDANGIVGQVQANKRIILTGPGFEAADSTIADRTKQNVMLNGRYSAAAVAGLISTLSPQSSPTNKVLPGVVHLATRFSHADLEKLVKGGVMVLEERQGVRVVRGLTTDNGAFKQVTTRRITDFAKAGIRQAADPFIGRLNNERVRKALHGTINGFLTTMLQDEQLTTYTLEVTATREDEINNRALVNAVLQPTFSIDFIAVTMVLQ
jgi:hypothetical protein